MDSKGLMGAPWSGSSGLVGTAQLGAATLGVSASSAAWPAANRAIFVPIRIAAPSTIYHLVMGAGVTAAGNFDIGVYDQWGNRLYSSGAIAKGTSTEHVHTLSSPLRVGIGRYYLALAANGTNNYVMSTMASAAAARMVGFLQMDSAYTLPATAIFASFTGVAAPTLGALLRRW